LPDAAPRENAPEKRRRLGRGAKVGLGIGVGILVLAGVAALGGSGSGSSTDLAVAPSQGSPSDSGATQSGVDPSASTSDAATPTAQVPSSMTLSQEQAVQAAESYLSMDSGFSYVGMLQQLMSPVADAFSKADAQFAIDYLKPDWNGQAIIAAKQYLSGGNGFSRAALIQQLTSSAGSGFTMKQALNAIDQLNPDWNAQAVDSAKGYLAVGGFSRQSLLEQLTSPAGAGFTKEQALYAIKKVGL
jgi:hypothetical protein